jgi:hypothetical protein
MNIIVKINCDNAAFENAEASESGRILRWLADRLEENEEVTPGDHLNLFDSNGNKVGEYKVTH